MRYRMLTALALLATPLAGAHASIAAPSPTYAIEGRWGTVRISAARMHTLVDAALATDDPDALLAGLPLDEQIALNYELNPATATRVSILGRCVDQTNDCDPADPAQPPEAEAEQPPPPPPTPTTTCRDDTSSIAAKSLLTREVVWTFIQQIRWCFDGTNVGNPNAYATYDVASNWWNCIDGEGAAFPITVQLPPGPYVDSPLVTVTSTGHCDYHPRFVINGREYDAGTQQQQPTIQTNLHGNGANETVRHS